MPYYDQSKRDKSEGSPSVSETENLMATTALRQSAASPARRSAGSGAIQTQCQSEHDREVPEVDLLSPL
ncbi:MAG: hypothetical protein ABI619_06350, partial [Betaproteobacteria bacterium]